MTYSEIIERAIIRAQELDPKLDWDRLRLAGDANFFSVNSQVSEAFAARDEKRELLRAFKSLTFTTGTASLSTDVLKKYIKDATLVVNSVEYSYRRYPDWLRGGDSRLGIWTQVGETIKAKTPAPVGNVSGSGTLSAICSPAIPATADDEYEAPDDMLPEFMDTLTLTMMKDAAIDTIAEAV